MSASVRNLEIALHEFVDRPLEEEITGLELFDIESLLNIALESLYESPAERSKSRESLTEAIAQIEATMKRRRG